MCHSFCLHYLCFILSIYLFIYIMYCYTYTSLQHSFNKPVQRNHNPNPSRLSQLRSVRHWRAIDMVVSLRCGGFGTEFQQVHWEHIAMAPKSLDVLAGVEAPQAVPWPKDCNKIPVRSQREGECPGSHMGLVKSIIVQGILTCCRAPYLQKLLSLNWLST